MLRKFDHDFRAPSIVADAVGAAAPDGIVCLTGVSDCGHVLLPLNVYRCSRASTPPRHRWLRERVTREREQKFRKCN